MIEKEDVEDLDGPHLPIHKGLEFETVKEKQLLPPEGRPPILRRDPRTTPHTKAKAKAVKQGRTRRRRKRQGRR